MENESSAQTALRNFFWHRLEFVLLLKQWVSFITLISKRAEFGDVLRIDGITILIHSLMLTWPNMYMYGHILHFMSTEEILVCQRCFLGKKIKCSSDVYCSNPIVVPLITRIVRSKCYLIFLIIGNRLQDLKVISI